MITQQNTNELWLLKQTTQQLQPHAYKLSLGFCLQQSISSLFRVDRKDARYEIFLPQWLQVASNRFSSHTVVLH